MAGLPEIRYVNRLELTAPVSVVPAQTASTNHGRYGATVFARLSLCA